MSAANRDHMVVWVAEDDEDSRAFVVGALQAAGHAILEAADGEELLQLIGEAQIEPSLRPDVLLTDVKMPRVSGLGVLEALRNTQWNVPVLVMTALSDATIHKLATQLGAAAILQKPFDHDDLLAAVRGALDAPPPSRSLRA